MSSFINFNKYKYIEKTLFNAFALRKNNYLKINIVFFTKFDQSIFYSNDFIILKAA